MKLLTDTSLVISPPKGISKKHMNNKGNSISAIAKALKEKGSALSLLKENEKILAKKPKKKNTVKSIWQTPTPMNIQAVQYKRPTGKEKIAVLAGSFAEYKHFLYENRENEHDTNFIYFDDPYRFRCLGLKYFIIIGKFWNRTDADIMFHEIKTEVARNIFSVYPPF